MRQTTSSVHASFFVVSVFSLATALVTIIGCSTSEFPVAPVSGVVTLDGKPLESARVVFQPRAAGNSPLAGGPSYGETDATGHYSLETHSGMPGAVIAVHRVMISTQKKKADPNGTTKVIVLAEERVPEEYHNKSQLNYTVPASGADDCNFELFTDGRDKRE